MRVKRLLVTVVVAVVTLGVTAMPASARRLGILNAEDGFRMEWPELGITAGGTTTTCRVSLEGTFHGASLSKTAGLLVGYVTRAGVQRCGEGQGATILTGTLPWHFTYASFSGTLPSINWVNFNIIGLAMSIDPAGGLPECLMRTDAAEPGRVSAGLASGTVAWFDWDTFQSIDLEDDRFLCAIGGDAELSGRAWPTILGNPTDPPFIVLI